MVNLVYGIEKPGMSPDASVVCHADANDVERICEEYRYNACVMLVSSGIHATKIA